ncbi:hypothetical protein [Photobacterium damselae]|uniref:Uncharacterized protein n=1 Tax=Photobacterium damselae subsp. damselae TaxID=85581 RepID=A0AAD3ZVV4_PHODD|nr:hypothetical protein [Photobacterium damselae]KAB1181436.1 hypothetical protein F6450_08775 [Photobacterium damselae subsp. damselae]PSB88667.1 hypothetical protein C5F63_07500 [Photobacterium damselae subsp. damselae]QSH59293.1 hypothetical protein A0J47_016330 [Photobacterium damselae subsp. damselae]UKA31027.1 hypothetical protein IPQ37_19980 [Photobacterium damselae subsp. damselae]SUB90123.1 Uncharacterised protein [Photobacterium damselae]
MAEIFAPSLNQAIYSGASGNLSAAVAQVKLKAVEADSVIHLLDLPIGVQIIGFDLVTDGLGAGVKLELKAGNTVIATNQDAGSKVAKCTPIKPIYIKEHDVQLDIVTTGAKATGDLLIFLKYCFVGF